jgi:uncharacterized membrane protein (UPF0127 family)
LKKGRAWPKLVSMKFMWPVGLTGLLLLCGCERDGIPAVRSQASASPSPAASAPIGQPQPKLPTVKLWLGPQEITAEQALSEGQIQTGMMFRKEMAENEGMLFVFSAPHQVSFWMRNTLIPLSCAYIDPEGAILEIHDMKALDETPIRSQTNRVQYVLEVNQGWFERNKVGVGMLVRTEQGTLRETYFAR